MPFRMLPLVLSVIAALLVFGTTTDGAGTPASAAGSLAGSAAKKRRKPKPTNLATSEDLWATINVCDTADHPNTIGIRGSMPGLGDRRSRLKMRFQVQYKARTDGRWHDADESADSGWKRVGRTRRQVIESGQNFTFEPPTDGGSHLLRGSVRFKWLRKGKVAARQRRVTEAGHESTAGADPKGYSAAECEITRP